MPPSVILQMGVFGHASVTPGAKASWAIFKVPSKIMNQFWEKDHAQGVSKQHHAF